MSDSFLDDYRSAFFKECDGLLSSMRESLAVLGDRPDELDEIRKVYRAAHNIKGISGIFGFDEVVDFLRSVESLLDNIKREEVKLHGETVALLLSSCDFIALLLQVEQNNEVRDEASYDTAEQLLARINSMSNQQLVFNQAT